MKYTIEITGLESGDVKVTVRSNGAITGEDLAKAIDSLMGSFGITGQKKVVDFVMLLIETAAIYENSPREMISIDCRKLKEQEENDGRG